MKLYEAGVRYTKEEADARSVTVNVEGGGAEQLVFTTEEMEQRKWAWVYDELARQGQQKERVKVVARITSWLNSQGAPYAYCAEFIVAEADRTGVSPYLCCAVGEAESSSGHAYPSGSFNAWGMASGAIRYLSWEDAIKHWYDNADMRWPDAQNGYDLENSATPYCDTNREQYASNVTGLCDSIAGL